jgi:transposase
VDECGISQCLVRERGRALRGVTIEDTKRGRKFQRTNVISARSKNKNGEIKHHATHCYPHNTDSEFFENWFKKSLVKSIERGSTIILDRASFHRRTKLKNLARRHGMKLLFLPAYSPDYNPIEKDWANMKSALIDSLPECKDIPSAVYAYFKADCPVNTS